MEPDLKSKTIPEAPKTTSLGFKGGVIQTFKTTGKATPNEFCSECGCKVGGCCPDEHAGNPCGGKK